jgi:hypothetical protein
MTIPKPKPAATAGGPTAAEKSWIPILADWKRSGQGVREFCRRRRLRESAFWFWRKELPDRERRRREGRQAKPVGPALRILPVRVVKEPASRAPLEVLVGGRTVRIPGDFDPGILRKVLGVLEGRP